MPAFSSVSTSCNVTAERNRDPMNRSGSHANRSPSEASQTGSYQGVAGVECGEPPNFSDLKLADEVAFAPTIPVTGNILNCL
jgi:hypothetical protein